MPQSLAQVLVHLIFSTKNREPFLSDEIRPELHPYMATILKGKESSAILINSLEDHAHVLFHLSKNHALCDVIESLKKRLLKVDQDQGKELSRLPLAERLRGFFGQPIQRGPGGPVHREAEGAPSKAHISRGVSYISKTIPGAI